MSGSASAVLVSTWAEGLFRVTGDTIHQELAGPVVRGLTRDQRGGFLAIVNTHTLSRRSAGGVWKVVVQSESPLSCCVTVGDFIFAGTDDANILRIGPNGQQRCLLGFDTVKGRETWYAGGAMIDGRRVGPPLGLRSITATRDGTLLANVHVGGIPRSTDRGETWHPTLDIECDVHEVCAHPSRPELVIAAAAVGLCISRDGGATWAIEQRGLHAPYCSAVAFSTTDIYVSASVDPFSAQGAIYRRPIDDTHGPLRLIGGGMPAWTQGVTDTGGIATHGASIAITDGAGFVYLSLDNGANWSQSPVRLPYTPSGIAIC